MTDEIPTWGDYMMENFKIIADALDEDLRPHVDEEGEEKLDTMVEEMEQVIESYE